jgi:hypothetical protein
MHTIDKGLPYVIQALDATATAVKHAAPETVSDLRSLGGCGGWI